MSSELAKLVTLLIESWWVAVSLDRFPTQLDLCRSWSICSIAVKLFRSGMVLIHVLFDINNVTGELPSTLGLVKTLEVIRFDRNSLSGPVPSNLNNLTSVHEFLCFIYGPNKLTGPMPNLTGLNILSYLMMENTNLEGQIPADLFGIPHLQTVIMKTNKLNGTLDLGTSYSEKLLVNVYRVGKCKRTLQTFPTKFLYLMKPKNCPSAPYNSDQNSSPTSQSAYPYTGTLVFRALSFSDLGNTTYYETLEQSLTTSFQSSYKLPIDSISLSNPCKNNFEYLELSIKVFPAGQDRFNRTGVFSVGFVLSYQIDKPPPLFGPYFFIGDQYHYFAGKSGGTNKLTSIGFTIGAAAAGCVILLLLLLAGVYAYRQKRRAENCQ
ncbi:protein kinase domain-containing protein [Citrus sinensis]|nr:protein kinase domain-containing protein [Citrus sinensis]